MRLLSFITFLSFVFVLGCEFDKSGVKLPCSKYAREDTYKALVVGDKLDNLTDDTSFQELAGASGSLKKAAKKFYKNYPSSEVYYSQRTGEAMAVHAYGKTLQSSVENTSGMNESEKFDTAVSTVKKFIRESGLYKVNNVENDLAAASRDFRDTGKGLYLLRMDHLKSGFTLYGGYLLAIFDSKGNLLSMITRLVPKTTKSVSSEATSPLWMKRAGTSYATTKSGGVNVTKKISVVHGAGISQVEKIQIVDGAKEKLEREIRTRRVWKDHKGVDGLYDLETVYEVGQFTKRYIYKVNEQTGNRELVDSKTYVMTPMPMDENRGVTKGGVMGALNNSIAADDWYNSPAYWVKAYRTAGGTVEVLSADTTSKDENTNGQSIWALGGKIPGIHDADEDEFVSVGDAKDGLLHWMFPFYLGGPITTFNSTWTDDVDINLNDNLNAATGLAYNLTTTLKYFKDNYGMRSWDDEGGVIRGAINVNPYSDTEPFFNAYAGLMGFIHVGDGVTDTGLTLGEGLDVIAHEFGHLITMHPWRMLYETESGAIQEALSDIFGNSVEGWINKDGSVNTLIGEETGYLIRNIFDPSAQKYPAPARYSEYIHLKKDGGGVHYNCSILSRALGLTITEDYASDETGVISLLLNMAKDVPFDETTLLEEFAAVTSAYCMMITEVSTGADYVNFDSALCRSVRARFCQTQLLTDAL